jgi:DNA polymerase III subunit delta'
MAFRDFPDQQQSLKLLDRSLAQGRVGHAYLFTGQDLDALEGLARTLAKTLNCRRPLAPGLARTDSCDECPSCRIIDSGNHADVHWLRPESKSRVITVDQIRNLIREIQLKPNDAECKVAVIVEADRLRVEAANAFLKTLEEPPPKSVLILLTTDREKMLDTILSRCLRLNFPGERSSPSGSGETEWLRRFTEVAAMEQKSLLSRYRLLDALLGRLTEIKARVESEKTSTSPLQRYKDADKALIERWEDELAAAIEAEYRRRRAELLQLVQKWLRDVWFQTILPDSPASFEAPVAEGSAGNLVDPVANVATTVVARRVSRGDALGNLETMEDLQRWLATNVQEALALEVGLLKLRL